MKKVMFVFLILISISFVFSAGVVEYKPGDTLDGVVQISVSNVPVDSRISISFSDGSTDSVGLSSYLNKSLMNYSCVPTDCKNNYVPDGSGELTKSFSLGDTLGVITTGSSIEANSFTFSVSSDVASSCVNQLGLDILDNGEINWVNSGTLAESCESEIKSICNTGGFNVEALIEQVPYCEKIRLPASSAFEVRAAISKTAEASFSSGLLKAWLYNSGGQPVAECDLSNPTGESFCTLKYAVKEEDDYFVCVSLRENEEAPHYKLKTRAGGEHCGFYGDPLTNDPVVDYDITVSSKKYSAVGSFVVNESTFDKQNTIALKNYLNNYIAERYTSGCSSGCAVPISFSGVGQNLVISNVMLNYKIPGISSVDENKIYKLSKTPAKTSISSYLFDISKANFKVPNIDGNYSYVLSLGGTVLTSGNISVSKTVQNYITQLYPKTVGAATSTIFTVLLKPSLNLSSVNFKWTFGDGSGVEASNEKSIIHTYPTIRNYTLKVEVYQASVMIDSAKFLINVVSPKEAINRTIVEYKGLLLAAETKMGGLSQEYKEAVETSFVLSDVRSDLNSIESEYRKMLLSSGTSESEYVGIMTSLVALDVPLEIGFSKRSNLDFIYDFNLIDFTLVGDLFDDYIYENQEAYAEASLDWYVANIDGGLVHNSLSVSYKDRIDVVLSEYNLKFSPKKTLEYKGYLVIEEDIDEIIFNGNYEIVEDSDSETGILIDLASASEISFALVSESGPYDIPIYFVPKLSELSVRDGSGFLPGPGFRWWKFLLALFILLAIAFGVYIFLQEWYKRNYEASLFSSRAKVYNLIYFIGNAKKQKLTDDNIREKLKKAKWSNEQITYAFNRFYGKRVGMWEIPIFYFRDKKKIQEEVARRNKGKRVI